MSEYDVMLVMDTMAQMYETLVKRIETLEREMEALRARPRKEWVNDLRPGVVLQPPELTPELTQEEVEDFKAAGVSDDNMDWVKALLDARGVR